MAVKWIPNGLLDIATDPQSLPSTVTGKDEVSNALTVCKNLSLDKEGMATTRRGSSKIFLTALDSLMPRLLIDQGGYLYAFSGTKIYRNNVSIKTGMTNARWEAVKYNAYNQTTQNIYAVNGTDRVRVEGANVYEWGIDAPTVAPTLAVGGSTGLTGNYNAQYTYCRKVGSVVVSESNPSPEGVGAVILANQSLSITWTASADAQVTHVRVYRTVAGGTDYYHVTDIAIGTTTYDSDEVDTALGSEAATNHDRTPVGNYVFGPSFTGMLFMCKANLLYYSLEKQPDYWPALYFIEISPPHYPLKAGCIYDGQIYVATTEEIYLIQGTGHSSFSPPLEMSAICGTVSPRVFVGIHGYGIFHLGNDGLYLHSGAKDECVTHSRFRPLFEGTTVGSIPGLNRTNIANCWLTYWNSKIYFGYPEAGETYPNNVIVTDLKTQKVTHYDYNKVFPTAGIDASNDRIVVADEDGYVREIEELSETDDDGTYISWEIKSKDYSGGLRKLFPRAARYDVSPGTGGTANATINLDGTGIQAHAITERKTNKRLIYGATGDRLAIYLTGTGPVDIYGAEVE